MFKMKIGWREKSFSVIKSHLESWELIEKSTNMQANWSNALACTGRSNCDQYACILVERSFIWVIFREHLDRMPQSKYIA